MGQETSMAKQKTEVKESTPAPSDTLHNEDGTGQTKNFNDLLLEGTEYNLRVSNLLVKTFQAGMSVILMLLHSGELHVLSAQSTTRHGLIYTISVSSFPVYFMAKCSSATWKRPWIPNILDAFMSFVAFGVYTLLALSLLLSLKTYDDVRMKLGIPSQNTKLNETATWIRLVLTIILMAIILFEGLTHALRMKLQYNICKRIAIRNLQRKGLKKESSHTE